MKKIPRELLKAKGTINALFTLTFDTDEATIQEMAEEMDVSRGTARERLDTFIGNGLVTEAAALRDGSAVRVFRITTDGEELAESLSDILIEDETQDE